LAESVITTMVLATLTFGMIDMGIAIFRMHVVSEAARQGARRASCQGSLAPGKLNGGPWGPSSFSGNGNSSSNIVTTISGYLTGLDLANTTINVTWPDGGNKAEQHVTYQVSTTWTPMITWVFGSPTYTLSGTSTMLITH
jgi:hypothetical protein